METLDVDITVATRDFRLTVAMSVGGEVFALVGPSAAGKTTTLRAIAGLVMPDRGRIACGETTWFDARTDTPAERRSVGVVFQHYALFPHMSVRENISFAGKDAGALLERFRLTTVATRRPHELSGGERQRVALARALARDPAVLLLDEPLAALDPETKHEVRAELSEVLRERNRPAIVVTHDYVDAVTLCERIGVLKDGRLLQTGTAADLGARPADPFVARFTGANVLHGIARPGAQGLTEVTLDAGGTIVAADDTSGPVAVIVQPWDITVAHATSDASTLNAIEGTVSSITHLGARARIAIGPVIAEITTSSAERLQLQRGTRAVAIFKATSIQLLPLPR